jgi:high affinity sulfate transporter 1
VGREERVSPSARRAGPKLIPLIGVLRSYDRSWLRGDLVAGFAVAALIIPKNLGYAGIAGIPLQNGLYAAAAGAILYAIFGTCRQISMGPSSGLAAVAASAVFAVGITGEAEVAAFVAGITLLSGILFLVLAVAKMGWIAQFLSRAVVTGFLFGAAIDVVIGELPKLTGTDADGSNSIWELLSWLGTLPDAHGPTMVVGMVALVVVFGLGVVAPRVPGALVLVVGGLLANVVLDLGERGVALVGEIPSGLPQLSVPDGRLLWEHAGTATTAAVALLLIGFSQTAGDARSFAAKHKYQIDINQESVAQALANTGSGLFQGMPVSTSLSASSLNDHTGARSGLASIVSGVTVLLTLVFLAPLFSGLPEPVLSALIIEAVVKGMMDVPEMRRLARVQRIDFLVALLAVVATLLVGVLAGVVIGIGLSLVWLIAVSTHPNLPLLGRKPGTEDFRDAAAHPGDEQVPGVAVIRVDGGLFFATADAVEDRVRNLIHERGDLRLLVLDCEGMNFVDSQGSAELLELIRLSREVDVSFRVVRLKSAVAAVLERDGVLADLGRDRVHAGVQEAIEADARRRSNGS